MDRVQLSQAAELLQRDSLLLSTKFSRIPNTHFINVRRMKGRFKLGGTQWFSI